jgi:sporulation protein YlmC with PRC-barrel domain
MAMRALAAALGITVITILPVEWAVAQQPSVLVGSDSLVGSTVRNADGVDVGKVTGLMIDPADGRVVTVLVSTGGTLGVGANTISVPWSAVKVGQDRGKLVVTASQTLEAAPSKSVSPPATPAAPTPSAPAR